MTTAMTHEEVGLLIPSGYSPRQLAAEEDHVRGDQRGGDAPSVVPKRTDAASCADPVRQYEQWPHGSARVSPK